MNCSVCNERFSSRSSLILHSSLCRRELSTIETEKDDEKDPDYEPDSSYDSSSDFHYSDLSSPIRELPSPWIADIGEFIDFPSPESEADEEEGRPTIGTSAINSIEIGVSSAEKEEGSRFCENNAAEEGRPTVGTAAINGSEIGASSAEKEEGSRFSVNNPEEVGWSTVGTAAINGVEIGASSAEKRKGPIFGGNNAAEEDRPTVGTSVTNGIEIQASSDEKEEDPRFSGNNAAEEGKPTSSTAAMNGIKVASSCNRGKRVWNKKLYCVFCEKFIKNKLSAHFESKHSNEMEVAKFLALQKGSKERKFLINKLVNRGYFKHNSMVMANGKGEIIPKKRRQAVVSPSKLLPCEHCGASYSIFELHRHVALCKLKAGFEKMPGRDKTIRSRGVFLLGSNDTTKSEFKEKVLCNMQVDKVSKEIAKDSLLLRWGEKLYQKYGNQRIRVIVNRIREVGRLIVKIKELNPNVNEFSDMYTKPNMYKYVKDAIYSPELANYNREKAVFKVPSLAKKLGAEIKELAIVYKGHYFEQGLEPDLASLNRFLALVDMNWHTDVEVVVTRSVRLNKRNKPKAKVVAKDMQILHSFLKKRSSLIMDEPDTINKLQSLSEVTLVQVLLLNFRRPGETEKIEVVDYNKALNAKKESIKDDELLNKILDPLEKAVADSWLRLEIEDKTEKSVPLLFSPKLQTSVEKINSLKNALKITNKYLFPSLAHKSGHFRAYDVLRKHAKACGANYPETIKATNVRKYIATMTQLLNLRKNELDSLAKFLGHDIRVHRQYYRLASETTDLCKVSKLLVKASRGNIADLKNKNLDDIDMEEELSGSEDEDGISDEYEFEEKEEIQRKTPKSALVFTSDDVLEKPDEESSPKPLPVLKMEKGKGKKRLVHQFEEREEKTRKTPKTALVSTSNDDLEKPEEESPKPLPILITGKTTNKKRLVDLKRIVEEPNEPPRKILKVDKAAKHKRLGWKEDEKKFVLAYFANFTMTKTLPSYNEIDKFLLQYGHKLSDENRSRARIKNCVYNTYSGALRKNKEIC